MKTKRFFVLSLFTLFVIYLASCSDEEAVPSIEYDSSISITPTHINGTHLSFQNIQSLVKAMHSQGYSNSSHARKKLSASKDEYVFITDNESGDTLFFVVNYAKGGWTMYASDTRVPAIVGEGGTGRFNLAEAEKIMGSWLESMKEDMCFIRQASDDELNFSEEEIAANERFWLAACSPDEYVASREDETRSHVIKPGYRPRLELYGIETSTVVYDSIPHLTNTYWHQDYPYNLYCPDKTILDYYEPQMPAGCVAIAGAQMLYYLHQKIGVPVQIPDSAVCNGTAASMQQWITGRNIWEKMEGNNGNHNYYAYDFNGNYVNAGTFAAPLVANVGTLVNMQYGNYGSGAQLTALVPMFYTYDIQCQYGSYSWGQVCQSLADSIPVIAGATEANSNYGHAFLIDGYKRLRTEYNYCYFLIYEYIGGDYEPILPNIDPNRPLSEQADRVFTEYSSPHISYISMNWGWGLNYLSNDTWFTSVDSWIAPNGSNYSSNKKIVSGFSAIE